MIVDVNDWVGGLKSEGLVAFALKYLERRGLYSQRSYPHQTPWSESEALLETVLRLKRDAEGTLQVKALQDAVRQERARRLRESKGVAIKRLSLSKKASSKLAQLSRQTGQTQSSVVEGLILEEIEVQKSESLYLRDRRDELRRRSEKQKARDESLKAQEEGVQDRLNKIAAMEEGLAVKLRPLEAMARVVETVKELEGGEVRIVFRLESDSSSLPSVVVESENTDEQVRDSLRQLWLQALEGLRTGESKEDEGKG